ncbi:riboflavin kinase [Onygenales sp. PD_10]|nr:riboflavin kinase [Onygenales sp. PD_10]
MRPDGPRDPVAGPDSGPEPPFPMKLSGPVIKGFGRGSKELGIPTANIPPDSLSAYGDVESGVYYGVAALDPAMFKYSRSSSNAPAAATDDDEGEKSAADADADADAAATEATIFPCVLSIGYNPFYKNTVRSVEIHLLPQFTPSSSPPTPSTTNPAQKPFHHLPDFYGADLNLLVLGYIRPEYDYVSLDALIEDIRIDCEVARRSLGRRGYVGYLGGGEGGVGVGVGVGEEVREARGWLGRFKRE